MSLDTNDLRPLCPTRWTVRTGAIGAVLSNYSRSTLCTLLDEVNRTGYDKYAMKAGGFLRMMEIVLFLSQTVSWCVAVIMHLTRKGYHDPRS